MFLFLSFAGMVIGKTGDFSESLVVAWRICMYRWSCYCGCSINAVFL